MKKALKALIVTVILSWVSAGSAAADVTYEIYLKNGSVLSGVTSIERLDGSVRVMWKGGYLGLRDEDIEKIETVGSIDYDEEEDEGKGPTVSKKPPKPDVAGEKKTVKKKPSPDDNRLKALNKKLAGINKRLSAMQNKLEDADDLVSEYNTVRLRIENLFGIGRRKAAADGKPASQYREYLTPNEREMLKINFIKKRTLKPGVESAKEDIGRLSEEKRRLLDEKRSVESEIKALGSG